MVWNHTLESNLTQVLGSDFDCLFYFLLSFVNEQVLKSDLDDLRYFILPFVNEDNLELDFDALCFLILSFVDKHATHGIRLSFLYVFFLFYHPWINIKHLDWIELALYTLTLFIGLCWKHFVLRWCNI